MRDVEHRLQCACVKWFRMQYPEYARLLFAIPNGGARDAITGRRMKEEGVVAGVADMFLAMPCGQRHGLFIEMKTGKGVQSNPQKEFQKSVTAAGYDYVIARSIEEFMYYVNGWIGIRNLIV